MNTRPLRIFLLGTTLAVGAVVGLAPTSDAKPIVVDPSGPPIVVAPPTTTPPTTKPPKGINPCDLVDCNDIPEVEVDPCTNIHACPTTTTPPTTTPPTTTPPTTRPPQKPIPPRKSGNPDVVVQTPRFTG